MKKTTIAIIALSCVIALLVAWIVVARVQGAKALKDASDHAKVIEDENKKLKEESSKVGSENAALKLTNEALVKQKDFDAKKLASQGATIARLEKALDDATHATGVVVEEGASVKEAFDAGKPLMLADAQKEWYGAVAAKLFPFLLDIGEFPATIAGLRLDVAKLRADNEDLVSSNIAQSLMIASQGLTIDAQKKDIEAHDATIASQGANITLLNGDIDKLKRDVQLGRIFGWIGAGAAILEAGYIVGHLALKWW